MWASGGMVYAVVSKTTGRKGREGSTPSSPTKSLNLPAPLFFQVQMLKYSL